MRVSYNWLKDYCNIRLTPKELAQKLTMAGLEVTSATRIDQDTIMEIEVTPNRSDCLSILGIAREIAAITGKALKLPKIPSLRGKSGARIPIQIKAPKYCSRYIGRVIKNVKIGPSPAWLRERLEVMGIHPVNNIVDITNFCLLEMGQPLHAFDLDKLQGNRIVVRCARKGEEIVTIDGISRRLEPQMLVIADKVSPQAIAGIMGAKGSEVTEGTANILLESAYFAAPNIQQSSRKLGLATQSSYRFERGVDFAGVNSASLRASELIKRLARSGKSRSKGVILGRAIDKGRKKAASAKNRVRLRLARLEQILGVEIAPAQIKEILRALRINIVRRNKVAFVVDIPSFRGDLYREADLVEEVARLFGYDNIPLNNSCLMSDLSSVGKQTLLSEQIFTSVRETLAATGLNEIMTYSLISRQALRRLEMPLEGSIAVSNPLSYEQEILRPTLVAGMLTTIHTNLNRKNDNLKLFELSRVYQRQEAKQIQEPVHLCIGLAGKKPENWLNKPGAYTFFDLKGIVETLLSQLGVADFSFQEAGLPLFIPGRSANVLVAGKASGFLGEIKRGILERYGISSSVYICILRLDKLLKDVRRQRRFLPLARFPSVERDISLIAPDAVHAEKIASLIKKNGRDLVTKVTLFDQYVGEQIPAGFRGLSYSVEYRSPERTLTAEEVDKIHQKLRQSLVEEFKVQIR
jgi:phenylalanyl-tRNA synthetase beta chain